MRASRAAAPEIEDGTSRRDLPSDPVEAGRVPRSDRVRLVRHAAVVPSRLRVVIHSGSPQSCHAAQNRGCAHFACAATCSCACLRARAAPAPPFHPS